MLNYDPVFWTRMWFKLFGEMYLDPLCHLISDQRGQREMINVHTGQISVINKALIKEGIL